jgi:hypothetical protein
MARGYISAEVKQRIRQQARFRCGYCLSPQRLLMARLEIEHIIPIAKGGADNETNLWLACPICNQHKSDKLDAIDPLTGLVTKLFNPRTDGWFDHFEWADDGIRILGRTSTGRATVEALHLSDDADALVVRELWVTAGWFPPKN